MRDSMFGYRWGWNFSWLGWGRMLWLAIQLDLQSRCPTFGVVLFGLRISYGWHLDTSRLTNFTTARPHPKYWLRKEFYRDRHRFWVESRITRQRFCELEPGLMTEEQMQILVDLMNDWWKVFDMPVQELSDV